MQHRIQIQFLPLLLLLLCSSTSLPAAVPSLQELPLRQALQVISERYQVIITYNDEHVDEVAVEFQIQSGETLKKAVYRLLADTELEFKQLSEKYLVVYHRGRANNGLWKPSRQQLGKAREIETGQDFTVVPVTSSMSAYLGKRSPLPRSDIEAFTVSGAVTDATGEPLIGVTIQEEGTGTGTITDLDGNYSLNVSDENAVLQFSYVGYERQTVEVDGRSTINVTMAVQAAALESVVVIGYGTRQKEELTSSVVSVQPEDFTEGANYDAVQLLNGAASGVNVTQTSSAPGAGLKIQIRGAGSVNSSNDVLFVVDGMPGVNPASLSPGDIASIDVLKDASAAAIYGTRAANGVVLITTKRGKPGKPSLTYNAYYGSQTNARTLDVLGAQDYANLVNSRAPDTYTEQEIADLGQGTNWQELLFQTAPVQNHQLSLAGGSEQGNYYLGLNYFDQEGIIRTSGAQKYNIRLNLESQPFDKLKISANANYTRRSFDRIDDSNGANEFAGPINSAIQFDPTLASGLNENGRYFQNPSIALDNPMALLYGYTEFAKVNEFYASINADYSLFEHLTATVRIGAESNSNRTDVYRDRSTLRGFANGGIGSVSFGANEHWLAEALLSYQRNFNEIHSFSLLGGFTLEEFLSNGLSGSAAGFLSDVTGTDLLQSGDGDENDNISTGRSKNQLNGIISRLTYGYRGKYLLSASLRVDGSSRFAEGNKYGVFPSVSLAWRLSEEPFLAGSGLIDDLKLRVGYGELGNQGINNFETRQTLVAQGNAVFGGRIAQGVRPARLPNPNLVWETTKEYNLGVDYALADYLFTGSIDFFSRSTEDQLFQKPLPSVVGFTSVRTNLGSVVNKGVDFSLRSRNISKETFAWSTNFTLSLLKNEVTELPPFTEDIISGSIGTFINQYNIVTVGSPLQAFYGYEIQGIYQTGDDIANSPIPDARPGDPRFVDQNEDGAITSDDRIILGDPFPDVTFGFANDFQVSNFNLEVLVLGVQGVETLDANVVESLYPTNSVRNSIARYYTDRWTETNPSNQLPSGIDPSRYGGARAINSLTVVDASYLRLKNITLGYRFTLGPNSPFRSLRLYGAADNLLTITDYEGFDPEASAAGSGSVSRVAYNSYPMARTYRFGIDISL